MVIPYNEEAKRLIEKLENFFLTREEFRKLRKYTVDIPFYRITEMDKHNAFKKVNEDIYVLSSIMGWYAKDSGLEDVFVSTAVMY